MTAIITPIRDESGRESLRIEGKKALYASYMPFLKNGGIFIPHVLDRAIGEIVNVDLTYVNDDGKEKSVVCVGRVVWKTPRGAAGGRTPGIGIQFTEAEGKDEMFMQRQLESCLGNALKCGEHTYTF